MIKQMVVAIGVGLLATSCWGKTLKCNSSDGLEAKAEESDKIRGCAFTPEMAQRIERIYGGDLLFVVVDADNSKGSADYSFCAGGFSTKIRAHFVSGVRDQVDIWGTALDADLPGHVKDMFGCQRFGAGGKAQFILTFPNDGKSGPKALEMSGYNWGLKFE